MLNMGGPSSREEVQGFLTNLFLDRDIIKLPMQVWLILQYLTRSCCGSLRAHTKKGTVVIPQDNSGSLAN